MPKYAVSYKYRKIDPKRKPEDNSGFTNSSATVQAESDVAAIVIVERSKPGHEVIVTGVRVVK